MQAAVVIPVHADPDGLRETLVALAGVDAEIVVVVDGPHAATEAVARDAGVRVLVQENAGSYAARQTGVDALADDVGAVLFTDAGCRPLPGWVDAHLAALRGAPLSGGAVEVVTRTPPSPAEWVDKHRYLRQEAYVRDGYAATCNLAVRREVLRAVRFDTTLRSGGDRDFCRRAGAAGFAIAYTPAAAIEHDARATSKAVLAKARRIGRGLGALPDSNRPNRLPIAVLGRRLAAEGGGGLLWRLRVMLLDARRIRATAAGAREGGWSPVPGVHAVVLLNARWSTLETHNTRWRRVVQAWAATGRFASVTVVDYPRFAPKRIARAWRLVGDVPSWLPGVRAVAVDVPLLPRPTPLDRVVWWWLARAVDRSLPAGRRLVVATTPLWVPLAARLPAERRAFDGMGDWRALDSVRHLRARVEQGYALARDLDVTTVVSDGLASTFRELGLEPVVVGNGVDVAAFAGDTQPPGGLPDGPFAVYVGAVQARVDLELLEAVAEAGLPVVVAGPAVGDVARRLQAGPLHWLGPVPTDQVPGLLKAAAVGLVPHRVDALTASMDPMKVLEYAAAGLPIVSTPVPLPPSVAPLVTVVDRQDFAVTALSVHRPDEPAVAVPDWAVVAEELAAVHLR